MTSDKNDGDDGGTEGRDPPRRLQFNENLENEFGHELNFNRWSVGEPQAAPEDSLRRRMSVLLLLLLIALAVFGGTLWWMTYVDQSQPSLDDEENSTLSNSNRPMSTLIR